MKVKIKLTVNQFISLLSFVRIEHYESLNDLQVLNIKLFIPIALKKLIDFNTNNGFDSTKTFSIEINQHAAIMSLLMNEKNNLDYYTLSILTTLQTQNKNLLKLSL